MSRAPSMNARTLGVAAAAVLAASLGVLGLTRLLDRDRAARDAEPVARSVEELVERYHLQLQADDGHREERPAALPADDMPTLVITRGGILFDGTEVVPLAGGDAGVDARYKKGGPDDLEIAPLEQALRARCERLRPAREAGDGYACSLRILEDEATPYRVLVEALYTAGAAGYARFFFVARGVDGGLVAVSSGAPRRAGRAARP